ncbi:hypothetical protein QAD02_018497 [Eretmocerus hayati]|uniref:Uncharacterized protein n=1 Tax=Eretmocerus hayati TaxID=131215 RepID=A0ACC2PGK5_9HYME|nr:hypothetical protein QAD02_018497 [Eretmocerus hayati]
MAMDVAQIFGDYIHLLGMVVLLAKIWLTKTCAGISGKTQLLYAIVFTTRYMDTAVRHNSLYSIVMRIVYISITYCLVLSVYVIFRKTYDRKHDAFRIELLLVPCALFAPFTSSSFESWIVLKTFSEQLEALAILPQVYLVSKGKQIDSIVVSYVACLGLHRGFYLSHHIFAYIRMGELDKMAIASGLVQLVFVCDLFARNLPILKAKGGPSPQRRRSSRDHTTSRRGHRRENNSVAEQNEEVIDQLKPENRGCLPMSRLQVDLQITPSSPEKIFDPSNRVAVICSTSSLELLQTMTCYYAFMGIFLRLTDAECDGFLLHFILC